MKQHTETAKAERGRGKEFDTPISYTFTWRTYENIEEVRAANDMLNDSEVVKVRNTEAKAKARNKSLNDALDAAGIEKPSIENDDQLRLREMFKVLMSTKRYTEEAARAKASAELEIEWAEE